MKTLKLANLIVEMPDDLSDNDCEYTEFFIIKIERYTVTSNSEPNYIHDRYDIEDFLDSDNY